MRYKFGIYYNAVGSQYVYTVGGVEIEYGEKLRLCLKFDISKLEWVPMPSLNNPRFGPGLFVSPDANVLYAFGGEHYSVERLRLDDAEATW
jgi:hypothetical protein